MLAQPTPAVPAHACPPILGDTTTPAALLVFRVPAREGSLVSILGRTAEAVLPHVGVQAHA